MKKPKAGSIRGAKRYWVQITGEQYTALEAMGLVQDRSVPYLVGRALGGPLGSDTVLSIRDRVAPVESP